MLKTSRPEDLSAIFRQGGIIAYPTEAVFGLGCDPDNEAAVLRLLAIKQRPVGKGLILLAADFSQVEQYLRPLQPEQQHCTEPSDVTYVYPALPSAPRWLTGEFDSLAVRITRHPLARKLCETLDSAIVSTSANLSGQPPAMTVEQIEQDLGDSIDAVLVGPLGQLDQPTSIRDSITGRVFR